MQEITMAHLYFADDLMIFCIVLSIMQRDFNWFKVVFRYTWLYDLADLFCSHYSFIFLFPLLLVCVCVCFSLQVYLIVLADLFCSHYSSFFFWCVCVSFFWCVHFWNPLHDENKLFFTEDFSYNSFPMDQLIWGSIQLFTRWQPR